MYEEHKGNEEPDNIEEYDKTFCEELKKARYEARKKMSMIKRDFPVFDALRDTYLKGFEDGQTKERLMHNTFCNADIVKRQARQDFAEEVCNCPICGTICYKHQKEALAKKMKK